MSYRRSLMVANAARPPYTFVNFLRQQNTEYINTGIKPKTGMATEVKFKYDLPNSVLDNDILGCYDGKRFYFPCIYQGNFRLGYDGVYTSSFTGSPGTIHTVNCVMADGSQRMSVDGNLVYASSGSGAISSTLVMFLFLRNQSGEARTQGAIHPTVYYAKIWYDDVLISYMRPALDSGGVPCMYDTVRKTPFYNAGSGTFLYG